ncbi:unnamed protein product [Porites lobata]|uniref:USP domain-containing protein n=1 Tax=Porites lobata TaxID=104759 RepID=A0ABN8PR35_9CNID|nr:unnamed protein product [Porites lobata]
MCSSCSSVTSTTTMETILPLNITKSTVIVHEGTKISSGHYIFYFKRGDEWYYSSDATIRQSSALEATSQEAYLLFYEKDDIEDVQEVRHVSAMSSNLKVKKKCQPQVPLKTQKGKMFPIKSSIPPGYYTSKLENLEFSRLLLQVYPGNIPLWTQHLSEKQKGLPWLELKL